MRDAVVPGRAGRLPTRPAGPQRHCTWAAGSTGTPYLPPEWGLAHRLPREPGGRGRSLGRGSEQAGAPATQPPSRGPGVRPARGATDRPSSSELAPPGQLAQRCQGLGRRPASYPARWFMGHTRTARDPVWRQPVGSPPAVHLATSRRLRAPAQTPGLGHPGFHKAQASQEPPPWQAPALTEMTPSAQPPQ